MGKMCLSNNSKKDDYSHLPGLGTGWVIEFWGGNPEGVK